MAQTAQTLEEALDGFDVTLLPRDPYESRHMFDGWPPPKWQRDISAWMVTSGDFNTIRFAYLGVRRDTVLNLLTDLFGGRNRQAGSIPAKDLRERIQPGRPALIVRFPVSPSDYASAWLVQHPADVAEGAHQ